MINNYSKSTDEERQYIDVQTGRIETEEEVLERVIEADEEFREAEQSGKVKVYNDVNEMFEDILDDDWLASDS